MTVQPVAIAELEPVEEGKHEDLIVAVASIICKECDGTDPLETYENVGIPRHTIFRYPARLIVATFLKSLPDICVHPMARPAEEYTLEKAEERVTAAFTIQQKGVPDQAALVWRSDLIHLHHDRVRLKSIENDWLEDREFRKVMTGEQCIMSCPVCEGEGEVADGVDEAACSEKCPRCAGNCYIVDFDALGKVEGVIPPLAELLGKVPFKNAAGAHIPSVVEAVQRLVERGRVHVDADGYLSPVAGEPNTHGEPFHGRADGWNPPMPPLYVEPGLRYHGPIGSVYSRFDPPFSDPFIPGRRVICPPGANIVFLDKHKMPIHIQHGGASTFCAVIPVNCYGINCVKQETPPPTFVPGCDNCRDGGPLMRDREIPYCGDCETQHPERTR